MNDKLNEIRDLYKNLDSADLEAVSALNDKVVLLRATQPLEYAVWLVELVDKSIKPLQDRIQRLEDDQNEIPK
jgi:hypothetical protein